MKTMMFRLNCRLPPIWEKRTSVLPELFPHGLSLLTFLLSSTQFPTSTLVEYFFSIFQPGVESAWGTAAVTNMVRILPRVPLTGQSQGTERYGGGYLSDPFLICLPRVGSRWPSVKLRKFKTKPGELTLENNVILDSLCWLSPWWQTLAADTLH